MTLIRSVNGKDIEISASEEAGILSEWDSKLVARQQREQEAQDRVTVEAAKSLVLEALIVEQAKSASAAKLIKDAAAIIKKG